MPRHFYKKNLASLKKHQPEAWKAITSNNTTLTTETVTDKEERPNLKVTTNTGETILLHRNTDEHLALQRVPEDFHSIIALFGMGLGYAALAICKQRPKCRHLIIFELHLDIFNQALHCQDLTPLLADPRLILILGETEDLNKALTPALIAIQQEPIIILQHQPSLAINRDAYQALHDNAFDIFNAYNIFGNTLRISGENFLNNAFGNLKSIHHNLLLENLHGAFKGIPAILVAGGPSLNKNIDQLAAAKGKALILAVDAALPALIAHKTTPDIVGALDSNVIAYEKIAANSHEAKNLLLACIPQVYAPTPKTFPAKQILWGFCRGAFEDSVFRAFGLKSLMTGAGTVAHMNIQIAASLGCSPIILVGQDLAFPAEGGNDHVEGATLNHTFDPNRTPPGKKDTLLWIDGYYGDKVPTTRAFLFLKQHFEHLIALNPNHYINATEGGAQIAGTQNLSLHEALKTYCDKPQSILTNIDAFINEKESPNTSKLTDWLTNTLAEVKKIHRIIEKTIELTTDANKTITDLQTTSETYTSFESLPTDLQKQINNIDRGQEQSDNPPEIWLILKDITGVGLQASERLKLEMQQLEGRSEKYLEYTQKSLERISTTNEFKLKALKFLERNIDETITFQKEEKELLTTLQKDDQNKEHRLELARFYFNANELVLAQPLLNDLHSTQPDSAEINFYLGCIAAKQTDYDKSANFFSTAKALNPDLEKQIKEFQHQLGDYYFELWQSRQEFPTMLNKGLKYCPTHSKINAQLDLIKITTAHSSPNPNQTDDLIRSWHNKLENDKDLSTTLDADQTAKLYAHHGQLMMCEGNTNEATKSFTRALDFTPENPDYHILMTETLFSSGNFDLGVEHLKKAVTINPAYAKHFEEIGDQLRQTEQHQDAIAAYEQCYAAQPENTMLLKKIGECYQALDMPENALKIYTLLKLRLETNTTN